MSMQEARSAGMATARADFGPVTVFFGEKNGKYPDANQVIVTGKDVRAALDAPLVANRIGAPFDEADLVVLTHVHEDHMAGLHRLPDAPVHVHCEDLAAAQSWQGYADALGVSEAVRPALLTKLQREFHYAPRPDAIPYDDGAVWDLGGVSMRAVHMPGHTAGHCALLIEKEGIAFIGDIDLSGFGPYYGDATSSLASFRRTLKQLPDLPARVWITGHHRGVYTDRAKFLADLAAYEAKLEARSQHLLDLLASPKSLEDLVACRLLYPPDHEELWVEDVERRTISQHLDELIEQGRVVEAEGIFAPVR
ncbi:MAG: Lactamase B [Xanthobacteraceae bacterium]|nr:MAG: Lactamase B [Xanthobacteraceae bacterium]